jgi:hypothetical protein
MTDAIRSEFRKLRTTRTAFGLLTGVVALTALALWGALSGASHAELAEGLSSPYGYAGVLIIVALFVLVLAIRAYTDEVRHGSVVPTFLATPNRLHLLAAKIAVVTAAAAVFAVAALAAGSGVIAWYLSAHGFAVANKLNRGFTSNGRENKSSMVDLKTLQTLSKIDTGKNPDYIFFR